MGLPTDLPMPAVAAPSSFVTSASGSRPLLANDPPRSAAPVNLGPMFRFKFLKIPKTFGEKILAVLLKKITVSKGECKNMYQWAQCYERSWAKAKKTHLAASSDF
jgi:hypothetical protein